MKDQNISDEYLNSFVDNQLDSAEKIRAYDFIRKNDELKDRVCELSNLKEMMLHAYQRPPDYQHQNRKHLHTWTTRAQALAACLLLLLGGVSGWLTHAWSGKTNGPDISIVAQATQNEDAIANTRKVILHLGSSSPMRLKAALDETESLLDSYRLANRPIQIEVITNKRGVDLLRSDKTTYENRISLLQGKYPNLNFLVCGKSIDKLRSAGEKIQLLPHVGVATSAADQINKRLHQGWGYVRI